jgi:hypothetical protein
MTIENELETLLVYEDKPIEEDTKLLAKRAANKARKLENKVRARKYAKSQGFKLGRWQGTFAKVKAGEKAGQFLNLTSLQLCVKRPGRECVPPGMLKK